MDKTECFCKIGSVAYPDYRLTNNYGTNSYNGAYKEVVNFIRNYNGLLDSIKPYVIHRTPKSSYRICMFVTRYQ